MAEDNVFEPGPSFVENDTPAERLTEMPAWLQTFAAQQIEADDEAAANAPVVQAAASPQSEPAAHAVSDSSLPDWLRDDTTQNHAQSSTYVGTLEAFDDFEDPANSNPDSFISEDDLPDWLRAFSDESSPAPIARSQAPDTRPSIRSTSGSSAMVRVPPVENVWLSTYERQALGPGPSLFALLASNTNGSPAYEAPQSNEAYATGGGGSTGNPSNAGQVERPGTSEPSQDIQPEGEPEEPGNSKRLLLLTLLVVALVILVSIVFFR